MRSSKLRETLLPLKNSIIFITAILLFTMTWCLPVNAGIEAVLEDSPLNKVNLMKLLSENPKASTAGDHKHYLGCLPSPSKGYQAINTSMMSCMIGSAVDLSSSLPPVGDQGNQGSCVGWATGYYYKTSQEKQEHTDWDLTNSKYQYSPSFIYNQINNGQDGGAYIRDALELLADKGAVDIEEMPYDDSDYTTQPTASQLQAALQYRNSGTVRYFFNIDNSLPNPIDKVKQWLANGKTLVMAIPIFTDFPGFGGSPNRAYYDRSKNSFWMGNHAVAIVGYDDNIHPTGKDADHKGGFKMVNSWGPSWNGSGFVYLSYHFIKRWAFEAWAQQDLSPDTPKITSLSQFYGNPGDSIEITGTNFGTNRREAYVTFNGANANCSSWSNTKIVVTIPTDGSTGPIKVYDWDNADSNGVTFYYGEPPPAPIISSFSTESGAIGSTVTISGNNFGVTREISTIKFGTIPAVTYSSWNDTQIQATVPGGISGTVTVVATTPGGTSNSMTFKVVPHINRLSSTSGKVGSYVYIVGNGFGNARGSSIVKFGRKTVTTYSSWNNTRLKVRVPRLAKGKRTMRVRTSGGASNRVSFTVK